MGLFLKQNVLFTAIQTVGFDIGGILCRDVQLPGKSAKMRLHSTKIAATVNEQLFWFVHVAIFRSPLQDISYVRGHDSPLSESQW